MRIKTTAKAYPVKVNQEPRRNKHINQVETKVTVSPTWHQLGNNHLKAADKKQ